jgi:hypothetical protein
MTQALESAKSNFMGMQSWLNKSLAKKEQHWAQLPTFQDRLSIIKVDLDCLQAKRAKLEVEYRKVEAN